METPEDDTIRQSFEAERELEQQKNPAPSILRKPLPPTPFANYPASQRPLTPPKSYPHYQPGGSGDGTQVDRYVSRGSHLRLNLARANSVPRKPLGARPLPSQLLDGDSADTSQSSQHSAGDNKDARRWSVPDRNPAPWVPRLQMPDAGALPQISANETHSTKDASSSSVRPGSPGAVTTITLIRRDPTSGIQWNVGSIQVIARQSSMALLQPVELVLTSPGYVKFARTPDSPRKQETFEDVMQGKPLDSGSPLSGSDHVFRRRLGFRPLPNDQKPSLQHIRTNSSGVLSNLTNGSSKKLQQVYAFTSLWQGVCAFSNGVDGRTLKCRHSLPTTSSYQEEIAAPVAEIRFNLPWAVLRQRDLNSERTGEAEKLPISQLVGKSTKEQWRRSIQSFKHHSWHGKRVDTDGESMMAPVPKNDFVQDEESRISLKLGREKAGGGIKGNNAKLGKLIIEDEGLKMCDLVVASCMGLWWQHYTEGNS